MVVLGETGYERFRVEDVAQRVGVAKGTVYLDFQSKKDLIDSAVRAAGERHVAEVAEAVEGISDPGERLLEATRMTAERLLNSPWLEILVECRPVQSGIEAGPEPCAPLRTYLQALVREALEARALVGRVDKVTTAEAILGLLSRPACRAVVAEVGLAEAGRRAGLEVSLSGSS